MNKYVVRAVADRDGHVETVFDDKEADFFGAYKILDDGTQEWVADFATRGHATAFCRFMERQGAVGEWRDRVMREAVDGKDTA